MLKNDIIQHLRYISENHGLDESAITAACDIIRDSDTAHLLEAVSRAASLISFSLALQQGVGGSRDLLGLME